MYNTVTFSTNVYYKTYEKVLLGGFLGEQLGLINYPFTEKIITINGFFAETEQIKIENIIKNNFPDFKYYFTEDQPGSHLLKSFNLKKDDIVPGYDYSIHHFTTFFHTASDYVFYIGDDCPIQYIDHNFIPRSIALMEKNQSVICTQPSWDKDSSGAIGEKVYEMDDFYIELGFTDQIYLGNMRYFKAHIYSLNHPASDRYPPYGANGFERRVDSYMQTHQRYRGVDKMSYYIHEGKKITWKK